MYKQIDQIRCILKNNLLNNNVFHGYEKERQQIFDLLERTVQFGESNSALLIGPRGTGKTALVNSLLSQLQILKNFSNNSITVKLNGLIHTDDRLALKSTTAQMQLENVVDGKVFGSFAENLAFLLACLRTGERHTSKSIIFILEEFDLFCAHHNQTLLYNLFDVSQSAQAPICILGITCRLDVIELLEKRVKSRFSHRQIFIFPNQYAEDDDDDSNSSRLSDLDQCLQRIQYYLSIPVDTRISKTIRQQWNSQFESLFGNKKFKTCIQRLVDIDNTERTLKDFLIQVVFQLKQGTNLTAELFIENMSLFERDDVTQILHDLTVLELCLVVAMKHHIEIYDNQPMNFEMILTRYIKFANANANVQTVQRPVIMKAFEHIQNLELISMIGVAATTRIQKEYQFFKLLVTPLQIAEAVKKSQGLPTEVVQWANSSLAYA